MRALAVFEQGVVVRLDDGLLSVEKDGIAVDRIRPDDVDVVESFGSVTWTPAALSALLARGVDVVLLTQRGRYRGRVTGRPGKNAPLRLGQYRTVEDARRRLDLSQAIVRAKIVNQRNLLLRLQRRHRDLSIADVLAELRVLRDRVPHTADVEALRGLEGRAAAVYFPALGAAVRDERFRFRERTRRPPRDPANAALSFLYTVLGSRIETLVLRASLDPLLGVFHRAEYGRPSLALDLLEEFRPVLVDALVLSLFNRRLLHPEDFEDARRHDDPLGEEDEQTGGVYLAESGRKIVFREWSRRLRQTVFYPPHRKRLEMQEILRQQVYRMARAFSDPDHVYEGFQPR